MLLWFHLGACRAGVMAPQAAKKTAGAKGSKKKAQTYVVDCTKPVEDKIMEIAAFEKFLTEKIKVNGKTGAYYICPVFACWRWTLLLIGLA